MPSEAAIHGHGWSTTDFLIADVLYSLSGEQHPSDPRRKHAERTERAALAEAKRRAELRRQRLGITGSVLRKEPP